MKVILKGFLIFLAFIFLLSAAFSCGGRRQLSALSELKAGISPVFPNAGEPRETTLDATLAELEALSPPIGVSAPVFKEIKSALADALRFRSVSKFISKPPAGEQNRVDDLTPIEDGAGGYILMWHYRNLGDYNQDGSVGVADITPLAIFYNSAAPDPNSLQGVIDGDNSRDINVADVTPIAMSFSTDCAGYLVQASPNMDGPWTSLGDFVPLTSGSGEGRRVFQFSLPLTASGYARVVPVDGSSQPGIESNVVAITAVSEFPVIIAVTPQEGVTGEDVTFNVAATGTPPLAYDWDFGGGATPDTSTDISPAVTLGSAGSYLASVQVSNGQGSVTQDFILTVTSSEMPPLIASVSPKEGITGTFLSFAANLSGTSPMRYSWDFGGGATPNSSTSATPIATLGAAGNYLASVQVSNAYGSETYEFDLTVTANGRPPAISEVTPVQGASGTRATFAARGNGTPPWSYSWNFGGGATPNTSKSASPTATLGAAGSYLASLVVTNAYGSDTFEFALTVTGNGNPPVIGSVSPQEGITGTNVTFTSDVTGAAPFSYSWNFGGGATPNTSSAASPTVTLGAPGSYSASLTVTNADGSDTYGFPVTVTISGNPPVIGSVSPTEGITATNATFTALVAGTSPFTYSWNFGGGATPNTSDAASPTVTLGAPGSYLASLVVTNGYGNDTYGFLITVTSAGVPPLIDGLSPEEGITGTLTTFAASISGTPPYSYSWNFGGGATPNTSVAASPTVTMGAVGSYTASLSVTSAYGSDTFEFELVVTQNGNPPVIGGVSPPEGIADSFVTFRAMLSGSSPFGYSWNFGGGATPNTSADASPTVTLGAPGNYSASLTVTNAFGSDTYNFTLTATESGRPPIVSGVIPAQGVSGTRTTFSANVTGTSPLSYIWNFGNGAVPNTSKKSNPKVKLKSPKSYSAFVTVTNTFGSDTFYFTLLVVP